MSLKHERVQFIPGWQENWDAWTHWRTCERTKSGTKRQLSELRPGAGPDPRSLLQQHGMEKVWSPGWILLPSITCRQERASGFTFWDPGPRLCVHMYSTYNMSNYSSICSLHSRERNISGKKKVVSGWGQKFEKVLFQLQYQMQPSQQ